MLGKKYLNMCIDYLIYCKLPTQDVTATKCILEIKEMPKCTKKYFNFSYRT